MGWRQEHGSKREEDKVSELNNNRESIGGNNKALTVGNGSMGRVKSRERPRQKVGWDSRIWFRNDGP